MRWCLFLLPVVFCAVALWLKFRQPETYLALAAEDQPLEMLEALSYFAAGILFLVAALSKKLDGGYFRWLWLIAAVVLIFVAGEEISWGQRLLGFQTPHYILVRNSQRELSIHNLGTLQRLLHPAYIAVGVVGGLGWLFLGWLTRRFARLGWIIPPWFLSSYFWPVGVVYSLLEAKIVQNGVELRGMPPVYSPEFVGLLDYVVSRDQEWAELMLAFVCVLLGVRAIRLARRSQQ